MSTHPYWSYEAVPGGLTEEAERAAVDEGRRAFALELAVRGNYYPSDEEAAFRATVFEAYLKGSGPVVLVEETEYENLVARSNHLLALEERGVDNWEGYVGG